VGWVEKDEEETRFRVRVQPGARRDEVVGWTPEGELKVRLRARPVEGAANRSLLAYLSKALGVRKGDLSLVAGERSRRKTIACRGDAEPALANFPQAS
jgi:uncharacterized protein (TIGR00251 family)